jgi:hypothetical protein
MAKQEPKRHYLLRGTAYSSLCGIVGTVSENKSKVTCKRCLKMLAKESSATETYVNAHMSAKKEAVVDHSIRIKYLSFRGYAYITDVIGLKTAEQLDKWLHPLVLKSYTSGASTEFCDNTGYRCIVLTLLAKENGDTVNTYRYLEHPIKLSKFKEVIEHIRKSGKRLHRLRKQFKKCEPMEVRL